MSTSRSVLHGAGCAHSLPAFPRSCPATWLLRNRAVIAAHSSQLSLPNTRTIISACTATSSKDTNWKNSFEDEEQLDTELAAELKRFTEPDRLKKMAQHYELAWKISKLSKPSKCTSCKGSGEAECQWCRGTGILMVGDTLFCSVTNHSNNCTVCKGKGYCKCDSCKGTGYRATWLEPPKEKDDKDT